MLGDDHHAVGASQQAVGEWRGVVDPAMVILEGVESALMALVDGDLSTFAALFGPYRGWRRLYRVTAEGLEPMLDRDLDPILRFVFRGGTERYLDRQLTQLGA